MPFGQRYPEAENTLAQLGYLERGSLFNKLPHETEEDVEAVEYLQGHQFSLKARLAFVEKEIEERKNEVRSVACPACAIGELFVRAEFTESFFVGEEMTFYWLPSMSLQEDGKIWMKVSGYRGEEHWSGAHAVLREQADYDFWLWLLSHKEHNPELIDDKQIEEIKSDWQRARE